MTRISKEKKMYWLLVIAGLVIAALSGVELVKLIIYEILHRPITAVLGIKMGVAALLILGGIQLAISCAGLAIAYYGFKQAKEMEG